MKIVVISTSLNSQSRSQRLAQECVRSLSELASEVQYINLRSEELPLCDGETTWDHPRVKSLQQQIKGADGIVIAAPIYNWSVAASTKNLLECAGHSLDHKVVAILCASGSSRAFMAPMALAQSLMADFQAIIVPKMVVIDEEQILEDRLTEETISRIEELAKSLVRLSSLLSPTAIG